MKRFFQASIYSSTLGRAHLLVDDPPDLLGDASEGTATASFLVW